MRADVAPPEALAALREAEQRAREQGMDADEAAFEKLVASLHEALDAVQPPRAHPRWRENVEILVVAVAVAMAFRTYFVQPFKIPTGSMQPTLYGITHTPNPQKKLLDVFPLSLVRMALFGESYVEVKAKSSGLVSARYERGMDFLRLYINGEPHRIAPEMTLYVQPGFSRVERGDVIAASRRRLGDHIFVNRVAYNFRRPRRGDIFVFSTDSIVYPSIKRDTFYIKRLVGLPGERISIDEPYLVADGRRVTEPYPFHRLLHEVDQGYIGYKWAHRDPSQAVRLGRREDVVELSATQYLPFGDNTQSSLDGRYFGPVERQYIVGPAFAVYWPFTRRWGRVQ
jgi:signal peptidase I